MHNDEIIFSDQAPSQTISSRMQRGELRRLARGIYTTDIDTPPEQVVRRNWPQIAGHEFPDAVISDRSAPTAAPVDGVLYVVSSRRRDLDLPGLTISARKGLPPQEDDVELPGGIT